MRIVVLAIDDDDVLGPPGDDQLTVNDDPAVPRTQPVAVGKDLRSPLGVQIDAGRDVLAANLDIAHRTFGNRLVGVIDDAILAAIDGMPQLHKADRILVICRGGLVALADSQAVTVHRDVLVVPIHRRERHTQRRFREPVDRQHSAAFQPERFERADELLTKLDRNRFGAVQQQTNAGQIQVGLRATRKRFQIVFIAEVRRGNLCCTEFMRFRHPQQRSTNEHARVHDRVMHAGRQHRQVIADQSHVMR